MQALQGKTTVITEGNSGIGLAIARRFASEGAYVFITGRHQGELDKPVAAIGTNVEAVAGDITEKASVARLFAAVQARRAGLDILRRIRICVAGGHYAAALRAHYRVERPR